MSLFDELPPQQRGEVWAAARRYMPFVAPGTVTTISAAVTAALAWQRLEIELMHAHVSLPR